MLVTILSDASHCSETGCGGWGAYIISKRKRLYAAGSLKTKCQTSHDAEFMAVINAIYVAMTYGVAEHGDELLIQCDNIRVVNHMGGYPTKAVPSQLERDCISKLHEMKANNNFSIRIRHIKAHNGVEEPRYYVHNKIDKMARKYMRGLRDNGPGAKRTVFEV